MIKHSFQHLMQQRFFLKCLLGLCIVSIVSHLNVSSNDSSQAQADSPVTVFVELAAQAQTGSSSSNVANAEVDTTDIENYARAVLDIEDIRLSTLTRIQTILGSTDVPTITCHQEETLNDLPSNAQDLVVTFCQASIGLVEKTGLSIEMFNQITNEQRDNEALQTAIQDALVRIQTTVVNEESVSRVQ